MSIAPGRVGVLVLLLLGVSLRVEAQEQRFEFAQVHLGMEVRLTVYAADSMQAQRAARAAFGCIEKLEDIMSDYRDESEIRRLAGRPGEWVPVSPELFRVLGEARMIAQRSSGAFDPTVGPLVALWREARKQGAFPSPEALIAARARTGWTLLSLDSAGSAVRLAVPGMRLDLGGIAKGFILEAALAELRRYGVARALLVAGGDIVAGDAPPGKAGWTVEVPGASKPIQGLAMNLAQRALAVSGDGEQFVMLEGRRYSHVIDPRTGIALTGGRRAYVVARSASTADAVATTLTVLTAAERASFLADYPDIVVDVIE